MERKSAQTHMFGKEHDANFLAIFDPLIPNIDEEYVDAFGRNRQIESVPQPIKISTSRFSVKLDGS
jgi:hypothetical protein